MSWKDSVDAIRKIKLCGRDNEKKIRDNLLVPRPTFPPADIVRQYLNSVNSITSITSIHIHLRRDKPYYSSTSAFSTRTRIIFTAVANEPPEMTRIRLDSAWIYAKGKEKLPWRRRKIELCSTQFPSVARIHRLHYLGEKPSPYCSWIFSVYWDFNTPMKSRCILKKVNNRKKEVVLIFRWQSVFLFAIPQRTFKIKCLLSYTTSKFIKYREFLPFFFEVSSYVFNLVLAKVTSGVVFKIYLGRSCFWRSF